MYIYTFTAACQDVECPNGSHCVSCENQEYYCNKSCDIDNGGCPAGTRCQEITNVTCAPGQCCSQFDIFCARKFKLNIFVNMYDC